MALQKNSPIPLYYQLMEQFREQIENGELGVGDRIPSVQDLSEQYQISPMTVHKAMGELVREGLLEVQRGIGTFVAAPKITYDLAHLTGFTEDMRSYGLTTHTRLLDLSLESPTERIAGRLDVGQDAKVVHIARLRYAGDTPTVLDESYLPASLCPGLEDGDLEQNSLYELLEGRYHLELDRATQVLEAAGANAYEAELFEVPVGFPMIMIRGVTYLTDNRPIEYFKVIYRGDRFKFQLETARLRKKG